MFNPLTQIHHRNGAYIVILALIFPACLLVMGVMVDIGLFYRSRAQFQSVADAAALAGAQDLPNYTTATASANYFMPAIFRTGAHQNYIPNRTATVDFSTDGQVFGATGSRFCRVTLTAPAQSAMMEYVLGHSTDITVQAVAVKENGGYAIFANEGTSNDNQSALYISANNVKIFGNMHSNKNLLINATSTTVSGDITLVGNSSTAHVTTPKKPMPELSELKGKQIPGNLFTFNQGVGTATSPVIYYAQSGNLIIQINTTAACYASFYAPKGNLSFQGNNLLMYGTAVANSIDLQVANIEIHAPDGAANSQVKLVK